MARGIKFLFEESKCYRLPSIDGARSKQMTKLTVGLRNRVFMILNHKLCCSGAIYSYSMKNSHTRPAYGPSIHPSSLVYGSCSIFTRFIEISLEAIYASNTAMFGEEGQKELVSHEWMELDVKLMCCEI